MPAFDLPLMYMPYAPRLNPNLAGARVHSKAWAKEIGILGPEQGESGSVWDERKFDTADFALFAARTYPDAPAPELDLLTDWGVWLFFFDDRIAVYKRNRDLEGAEKFLTRLSTFMPLPLVASPPPENPVERGLTDLWSRTLPSRSATWGTRFAESTRWAIHEGPLWEISNYRFDHSPNPIEYIEMRRKVGGAPWAADLVEHALGGEIPPEIADTRPMRVLRDAFSDGVHLRNDLYSYQKETEVEGEIHNSVLVLEAFLGWEPQRAADLVNDLATSRMQLFERTIVTELPALFEEHALGLPERTRVLRYVKGLQDWMGGDHEWHLRTSRYAVGGATEPEVCSRPRVGLTGVGTSSARIAAALRRGHARVSELANQGRTVTDGFQPPEHYMPFSARQNPHLDPLRAHTGIWVAEMGLLVPSALGPSPWDAGYLDVADFALLASLTHPDAQYERLALVNDWNVFGFFLDDVFVQRYKRSRDLAGAKAFLKRLHAFVPGDSTDTPAPTHPAERALADLWSRTAPGMSAERQRRFSHLNRLHFDSYLWELANLTLARLPDSIDYVEMRRKSFAADWAAEMAQHAAGLELDSEILHVRPIHELTFSFCDVVCLRNDIVSYRKEIEHEHDINNGVLVVRQLLGSDLQEAAAAVNDLASARLRQFEYILRSLVPAFFAKTGDAKTRQRILRYADLLKDWMAGYVRWTQETGRYAMDRGVPSSARTSRAGTGPTGLGTSAARLIAPGAPGTHSCRRGTEHNQSSPSLTLSSR